MFNTSVFDYINVLQKTADAAWIRNDVIANNIANATTPGYKRQDIAFEDELSKALRHSRYKSMDAKVADLKMNRLKPAPIRIRLTIRTVWMAIMWILKRKT